MWNEIISLFYNWLLLLTIMFVEFILVAFSLLHSRGLQAGVNLPPPGDIWQCFGCHNWWWGGGVAAGIQWVEARNVGEHFLMHRTIPHSKELTSC